MPRVSREQARSNRAAITSASSRLFRERGLAGVSIADLMAAAGLTHGGFYGHFASKEMLEAEACAEAFAQADANWTRRVSKADPATAKAALVEPYLSSGNRSHPGTGCPGPALATDVARAPADAPIRAAYTAGIARLLDILATTEHNGDEAVDRQQALVDFSTMVGALLLARATDGDPLSDAFLSAARTHLAKPVAKASKRRTSRAAER